jgi:hypothetical protein
VRFPSTQLLNTISSAHEPSRAELAMSFLEKVKEREAEKQRRKDEIEKKMPEWVQAVSQLCTLIRQRVQPPSQTRRFGETPIVRAQRLDCRLDNFQLDSLEIAYKLEGMSATVKPLSLSDPNVRGAAGCVLLEGQGQVYRLLWDGGEPRSVVGHWQINDSDGGKKALTEDSLDETLEIVFGLTEKTPKTPKRRIRV